MSTQQRINVSVKLFETLDRKDKLEREIEQLNTHIAMYRAFLEGHDVAALAAQALAQQAEAAQSSPTEGSGSVEDHIPLPAEVE